MSSPEAKQNQQLAFPNSQKEYHHNEPSGPLTTAAVVGISAPLDFLLRSIDSGKSTKSNETSGGTRIALLPTRDCVGTVVEKHCVCRDKENAGVRKVGNELRLSAARESGLK